jgi:hypothetical protein
MRQVVLDDLLRMAVALEEVEPDRWAGAVRAWCMLAHAQDCGAKRMGARSEWPGVLALVVPSSLRPFRAEAGGIARLGAVCAGILDWQTEQAVRGGRRSRR